MLNLNQITRNAVYRGGGGGAGRAGGGGGGQGERGRDGVRDKESMIKKKK